MRTVLSVGTSCDGCVGSLYPGTVLIWNFLNGVQSHFSSSSSVVSKVKGKLFSSVSLNSPPLPGWVSWALGKRSVFYLSGSHFLPLWATFEDTQCPPISKSSAYPTTTSIGSIFYLSSHHFFYLSRYFPHINWLTHEEGAFFLLFLAASDVPS